MNSVIDCLRQSPKGRLQYTREIDGSPLKELLQKCSSVPTLSSPHTEKAVTCHDLSPKRGSPLAKEDEGMLDNCGDKAYTEKGLRDSKEVEMTREGKLTADGLCEMGGGLGSLKRSPQPDKESRDPLAKEENKDNQDPLAPESSKENQDPLAPESSKESRDPLAPESSKESRDPLDKEEKSVPSAVGGDRNVRSITSPNQSDNREKMRLEDEDLMQAFVEKLLQVHEVEKHWDNKTKAHLEKKNQEFWDHHHAVNSNHVHLLSVVEQRQLQDLQEQRNIIERMHMSRAPDIHQAVQRVKETHDQCLRRQDAKYKEVERLGQLLQEEKVRRQQLLDQRLEELRTMAQTAAGLKTTLFTMLDSCPHKEHLSPLSEKAKVLVTKLSEQADMLVKSADRNSDLDDLFAKLKNLQDLSQNALDMVNGFIVEAERKVRCSAEEAERQQQTAARDQQPQSAGQTAAETAGTAQLRHAADVQSLVSEDALTIVAKEYENNIKLIYNIDAELQSFVADQQWKKVRFDLQRAVNTPVNAISPSSSTHLRDKLVRLQLLLKGDIVEVTGKQVTATSAPKGVAFCKNLTAKMIAKKADEQVSSNHESAFAIAAVAVGLWVEYPDFGDLLIAHLQALCPYILPFYPPRLPNQSTVDYHKTLGYKIAEDGTIESQDKYLRRMSGLMRLYAAILVSAPPQGPNTPHPHGLQHAWAWLGRVMNLSPDPDITAASIHDVLQVTGHFLLKAYRVQFAKLLHCLYQVFLPKLKEVAAGSGPVSRLETFLEHTMKNNAHIPEPKGYLPPRFWNF